MTKKTKNGFTLIEVLVASTIIAVLAAVGMVSYAQATKKSRNTKRKADLAQVQAALEMYRTDNAAYPIATDIDIASGTLVTELKNKGYIADIPNDPKNDTTHKYWYTGTSYTYCLSANVEETSSCTICTGNGSANYCVKQP